MLRRICSSTVLLVMLSVISLGDGRLFAGKREDCATQMAHGHQQQSPPAKDRCDLPWSPGCASASACVQPVPVTTAPEEIEARHGQSVPSSAVFRAPEAVDIAPDHPPPRV
jgi:hypothetical protein